MECFAFIVYVRWTSCVIKFNDIEQDHTTFIGWVIASRLISLAQELRVCLWIILCRVCGGHLVQLRVDLVSCAYGLDIFLWNILFCCQYCDKIYTQIFCTKCYDLLFLLYVHLFYLKDDVCILYFIGFFKQKDWGVFRRNRL
eukprot:105170_1